MENISRTTYSAEVRWSTIWDTYTTPLKVSGYPTQDAAWEALLTTLYAEGWTPPRWWEAWRWQDTRVPQEVLARYWQGRGERAPTGSRRKLAGHSPHRQP